MKHWVLLICLTLISSPIWSAIHDEQVQENLYQQFRQSLTNESQSSKGLYGISPLEQGLFVDALWDRIHEGSPEALRALTKIKPFYYEVVEKLRLEILKIKFRRQKTLSRSLVLEIENALRKPDEGQTKLVLIMATYEKLLLKAGQRSLIELAQTHGAYSQIQAKNEIPMVSDQVLSDLFYNSPVKEIVQLHMYCRKNRLYPCLMLMRDIHGEVVKTHDGHLWTHKSLASSKFGLPSHVRNGNTPAGVWQINSVMPVADDQLSFGQYRRVILKFIEKSEDEELIKNYLPENSHSELWWLPVVTARNVGRNLFRIHGTGKINQNPKSPFYPFRQTSGCIAQRENTYGNVTFKDQRVLLDSLMEAMELDPVFENETKIKAVLYLIELDEKESPVTLLDLNSRGIH